MSKKLPRIGYIVNTYPRPSHSFIRREIVAVERIGFDVHRFAMRGDLAQLKDAGDLAEHERTERVLERGSRGLAGAFFGAAFRKPRQFLTALRRARSRAKAGESSFPRQMIYLAEGAIVAARAKELGLDHLHAHFGTNSTSVAQYAHLLSGVPYSFTVHGPEEFDRPEAFDLGAKIADAKFCAAISSFGRSQLFRWAEPADWAKVEIVHCGIEPARWGAPSAFPGGMALRLVAVGRFAEQKGFGLLIDAFAKAHRQNPNLQLSLVGDGPLRPEIEALIRRESLGDAVELLGWQDETGVRAAVTAAHLMVMPSFAEGLPVVIMEAMASARPIIATYIAGIPELVRPGQEGWLVPAGDSAALAEAMLTAAAADRVTLEAMGAAARCRVLARHDIDASAEKLAQLFTATAN
ncbi:glycosyltransferase [Paracoccus aminophilus]|uniref:Glycosyl transferase n=1 Tax=Paracoccus aminophilus JCM 7686 TaxID=1367847 RepID=S5Y348_PARAH|nr:glycosyltransferase [Paracoccus aminophilus]AGT10170.1 glycosyl transferase [Paracoccus aminophilus JCM 7686]